MESKKSSIAGPVEGSSSTPERLPMARNEFGTSGNTQELSTNYFRVLMAPPKNADDAYFYLYDVSLKGKNGHLPNAKDIGKEVMDKARQTHLTELGGVHFAYDGDKTLVTIRSLQQLEVKFDVVLEDESSNRRSTARDVGGESDRKRSRLPYRSRTFEVKITFRQTYSMDYIAKVANKEPSELHQDAFRALDIILRQHAAEEDRLIFRQSFFDTRKILKHFEDSVNAVEAFQGFSSSFKATQSGLFLNMDVSHTLILKSGSVGDILKCAQNVKNIKGIDWNKAQRMLKNLRVKTLHTNAERRIWGLSEKPCKEQTFLMKQGNEGAAEGEIKVTVYDYFVNHKKIMLDRSGDFPCINVGKSGHPVYIPLELCELVPLQPYTKSLSTELRSSLVEKSRQKPHERKDALEKEMRSINYDSHTMLSDSGISIETQFTRVDGRILPAPKLKVGKKKDLYPKSGRWNFNKQKLHDPAKILSWLVANFSSECDVKTLIKDLIDCAESKGLSMGHPADEFNEEPEHKDETASVRVDKMISSMKRALKSPLTFILCILPQKKNCDIYGPWKRLCLSDYGIPTQCIAPVAPSSASSRASASRASASGTSSRMSHQSLTNVILKINAKLGGLNFSLSPDHCFFLGKVLNTPTLILGMDVCHGPPGQTDMPSIAAVVSSRNWPSICHYRAAVRTQSPKREMIDSLFDPQSESKDNGIIRSALRDFEKTSKSNRRPEQIIIFRDGVGESQFKQVLNHELDQIIKACKAKYGEWCPKFTVIVAQKRHHTRFFLKKSKPSFINVLPGTIVDTEICHPRNNDFYLCAHAGLLGTSRPAHYHVLLDEIGFRANELHKIVHSLCYIYQRSTTAVSVVAPIGYAHLAAAQVAQMIKSEDFSVSSSSSHRAAASSSSPAAAAAASSSSPAAAAAASSSSPAAAAAASSSSPAARAASSSSPAARAAAARAAAAASSSSPAAAAASSSSPAAAARAAAAASPLPKLPRIRRAVAEKMFFC